MKHVVGIADMKISTVPDDVIVTYAIGSCMGIYACDRKAGVGGVLHVMMPEARINVEKAGANPFMFVDTGLPRFIDELKKLGALPSQLTVKIAGGAQLGNGTNNGYNVGKCNDTAVREMLGKMGLKIESGDTGGASTRTMYAEAGTGKVTLNTAGELKEI